MVAELLIFITCLIIIMILLYKLSKQEKQVEVSEYTLI